MEKNQYVTNPISWDESRTATIKDHKGLFFYDEKIYPNSVYRINDGLIWSSVPRGIKGNLFVN